MHTQTTTCGIPTLNEPYWMTALNWGWLTNLDKTKRNCALTDRMRCGTNQTYIKKIIITIKYRYWTIKVCVTINKISQGRRQKTSLKKSIKILLGPIPSGGSKVSPLVPDDLHFFSLHCPWGNPSSEFVHWAWPLYIPPSRRKNCVHTIFR